MPDVSTLPDPETIRRTADEVVRRPMFQLEARADSGDTVLEWLLRMLHAAAEPFRWLADALSGLPGWLRWPIFVALIAVLALLIAHIGYTIVMAVRGPRRKAGLAGLEIAEKRDPDALERAAAQAVAQGDYSLAIRLLFRASLLRLEAAEKRKFRAGTTNREHLRRHRDTPVFESLKLFVETIELKWYGPGMCGREDYEICLAAHARIRRLARGPADAERP